MANWFGAPKNPEIAPGNPPGKSYQETLDDYYKNYVPRTSLGKRMGQGWFQAYDQGNNPENSQDWQKWLNQFGYSGLNNYPLPKLGWFGMGGFPNNAGKMVPWWQYWGGGRPSLGGGFYGS